MAEMIDDIAHITQDIGPHPSGTEEEQQVALYLAEKIQNEAGFQTIIEDFRCVTNDQVPRLICFGVALLATFIALIAPAASLPCFVFMLAAAVLFVLEVTGKPVISRFLRTGASQNVVAKYQPHVPGTAARRRKVILVANYDSGKVLMEEKPPVARFLPILQKASGIALLAAPILLFLRMTLFAGESNPIGAVASFLLIICLILLILPVVRSVLHIVAPYNQSANNNTSGVAVLTQVARMVGRGLVSNEELAERGAREGSTVHGEEAARAAGAVPRGATVEYDAEIGSRESLAAAKAAIAALTGKPLADKVPVSDISQHLVHGGGLLEEDESASTVRFEESPQRPPRERPSFASRTMVSTDDEPEPAPRRAEAKPSAERKVAPEPARTPVQKIEQAKAEEQAAQEAAAAAQAAEQQAAAAAAAALERSSFERQTPAALQGSMTGMASSVDKTPAWARAAQAKARANKPEASQPRSVVRSRYADAPAAHMADTQMQAVAYSAEAAAAAGALGEEPVAEQSELSRKLAALRSEIESAEAPHAAQHPVADAVASEPVSAPQVSVQRGSASQAPVAQAPVAQAPAPQAQPESPDVQDVAEPQPKESFVPVSATASVSPEKPSVSAAAAPVEVSPSAKESASRVEPTPRMKPVSSDEPEEEPASQTAPMEPIDESIDESIEQFAPVEGPVEELVEPEEKPSFHIPRPRSRAGKQVSGFASSITQRARELRSRVNLTPHIRQEAEEEEELGETAPMAVVPDEAQAATQETTVMSVVSEQDSAEEVALSGVSDAAQAEPPAATGSKPARAPRIARGNILHRASKSASAAPASEPAPSAPANEPSVEAEAAQGTPASMTTAMPPIDVSSFLDREELDEPASEPLTAAGRVMAGRVSVPYGEDIEIREPEPIYRSEPVYEPEPELEAAPEPDFAPSAEPAFKPTEPVSAPEPATSFDEASAEATTQRVSSAEIQEAIQEASSREVRLSPRDDEAVSEVPVSPIVGMENILPQVPLASERAEESAEPVKQVIVLPDVVATHSSEGGKQRAPMAEASQNTRAGTKSLLSNMLPSIEEFSTPAQPHDTFGEGLPPIGANEPVQQAVSITGSFSTVGGTGSFTPVGDELVADIAPEDRYVDDADDSAYDESYTETGAFAGPGYVDMPKSRVGRFFGRFRKNKKNQQPEPTVREWVGADENYDARSVGKARGDWSSFREENRAAEKPEGEKSAPEKSAPAVDENGFVEVDYHDTDFDDRRGWKGGAFSLSRLRKGGAAQEAEPAAEAEAAPADAGYVAESPAVRIDGDIDTAEEINRELRKLQDFRHPDINTEVWFVALGSELYSHSGMNAFLEQHADELKGAIIINLEALGAGSITALESEGVYKTVKPSSRIKRVLRQASERSGVPYRSEPMSARETAASIALAHGVQALTVCGMADGNTALYAADNDVIENMDEDQLKQAANFVMNILKAI